ncbi:hypothetical protein E2562_008249 [Oryza meyeriana var. granulata]|uniref:Uncharacterized protein n=1 Tax=Oryza meyeriana var. granulata TaxID=110450 RepID=A0A6G1DI27_9ORYZ|nr:hypothetical protein E2562_008249 [Oryza meyeriana var. granulata]
MEERRGGDDWLHQIRCQEKAQRHGWGCRVTALPRHAVCGPPIKPSATRRTGNRRRDNQIHSRTPSAPSTSSSTAGAGILATYLDLYRERADLKQLGCLL